MMKFFTTIFCVLISNLIFSNPISGYKITIEYDPVPLLTHFYDVNLYSPNGVVMRNQPYNAGGGTYGVFFGRETDVSTLRTYYAYLDNSGNVTNTSTISADDLEETFPSLAIDKVTGDPIAAWNSEYGIMCSYDLSHFIPGLWITPHQIFNNTSVFHHSDDEFANPIVEIGDSPDPDKRRVYFLAHNQREFVAGEEYCHAMLGYDDFDINFFNILQSFELTYVPLLISQDEIMHFSFTVGDAGSIAVAGYTNEQKVFVCINGNYGEGDFMYFEEEFKFPVDNPLNQDGTPRFTDDQGNPYELFFGPHFAGNFNTIFNSDDEKIIFPTSFSLCAEPDIYQIEECLLFPKVVSFDLSSQEFSFADIHPAGENPNDDIPMLPWDIDEDGNVDSYDPDGKVDWIPCWPIFYYDHFLPYAVDNNNLRITQNKDTGLISVLWNESTKPYFASEGSSGLLAWEDVPEMVISFSEDAGITWSPTQCFNSINNPELDGIIPEFSYPSADITEQNSSEYNLQALFFDDSEYAPPGSFPQNPGGNVTYLTFKYEIDLTNNNLIFNEPTAGYVWQTGENVTISWTEYGTMIPLKIDLVDQQNEFVCRIEDDPMNNSCEWNVLSGIESGDNYKIRAMVLSPPGFQFSESFSILNLYSSEDEILVTNKLFQNTPNPFNPSTTISFSITAKDAKDSKIDIYNSKGQKVKQLVSDQLSAGQHTIVWNGDDDNGKPVSSGVYLYRLKSGDFEASKKMLLLR